MSETSDVHVWDVKRFINAVDNESDEPRHSQRSLTATPQRPLHTFSGHREEGYALDWSRVTAGRLLTGR
jgi:ribosome assembly protein RRB1